MNQLKTYRIGFFVLLFLNIAILSFFVLTRPTHPKHSAHRLKDEAKKIMGLDETQNKDFLDYARAQRELINSLNQKQKKLLNQHFSQLISNENSRDSVDFITRVQVLEKMKIEATYAHFEDIKAILRVDQIEGFNEFMVIALNRILKPERPALKKGKG